MPAPGFPVAGKACENHRTMPHLFLDISSHGLGHLAQVAPVVNELAVRVPDLRLTVRSALSPSRLRARLRPDFMHVAERSDFGFVMHDAVRIDYEATATLYRAWHLDWASRVSAEAAFLRSLAPDLALTDVAYLPLAGAATAGVPAVAMCSLNWADLFAHVFGDAPWAAQIHAEILAAYRSAACFLRLTPAMPMPALPNARAVPPVAALGCDRRDALRSLLKMRDGERVVLVAFGGFDKALGADRWPTTAGVRWLVPGSWGVGREDMAALEALPMNFTDLLRSVDAVLTKPGYGTFTEAACNGTPVLYVRRDDWPEQDCLIDWLRENARCSELEECTLLSRSMRSLLDALWAQSAPPLPRPNGAAVAAELIAGRLPSRS